MLVRLLFRDSLHTAVNPFADLGLSSCLAVTSLSVVVSLPRKRYGLKQSEKASLHHFHDFFPLFFPIHHYCQYNFLDMF